MSPHPSDGAEHKTTSMSVVFTLPAFSFVSFVTKVITKTDTRTERQNFPCAIQLIKGKFYP